MSNGSVLHLIPQGDSLLRIRRFVDDSREAALRSTGNNLGKAKASVVGEITQDLYVVGISARKSTVVERGPTCVAYWSRFCQSSSDTPDSDFKRCKSVNLPS
jgi:hypothetical protein